MAGCGFGPRSHNRYGHGGFRDWTSRDASAMVCYRRSPPTPMGVGRFTPRLPCNVTAAPRSQCRRAPQRPGPIVRAPSACDDPVADSQRCGNLPVVAPEFVLQLQDFPTARHGQLLLGQRLPPLLEGSLRGREKTSLPKAGQRRYSLTPGWTACVGIRIWGRARFRSAPPRRHGPHAVARRRRRHAAPGDPVRARIS